MLVQNALESLSFVENGNGWSSAELVQNVTQTEEVHHSLFNCQGMSDHQMQLMVITVDIWYLSVQFLLSFFSMFT